MKKTILALSISIILSACGGGGPDCLTKEEHTDVLKRLVIAEESGDNFEVTRLTAVLVDDGRCNK